jgi:hypothetical protein
LSQFAKGYDKEPIYGMASGTDSADFIRCFHHLYESLYYIFLNEYHTGLKGYWNHSVEKGKSESKGRDSTPGWLNTKNLARAALEKAQIAWNLRKRSKIDEFKVSVEHIFELLAQKYIPPIFSPIK